MTASGSGWDRELPARALAAYHELCADDGIDPDTELVAARLAANLTAGEWIAVRLARADSGRPAPDLKPINAGDVVSEVRGARSDLAWAAATCGSVEVRRTVAAQLPDTHPALALLAADPDLRVRAATASPHHRPCRPRPARRRSGGACAGRARPQPAAPRQHRARRPQRPRPAGPPQRRRTPVRARRMSVLDDLIDAGRSAGRRWS